MEEMEAFEEARDPTVPGPTTTIEFIEGDGDEDDNLEPNAQPVIYLADDISIINITKDGVDSPNLENESFSSKDNDDILIATLHVELHGLEDCQLQQMGVDIPEDSPPKKTADNERAAGKTTDAAPLAPLAPTQNAQSPTQNASSHNCKRKVQQSQLKMAPESTKKNKTDRLTTPKWKTRKQTREVNVRRSPCLAQKPKKNCTVTGSSGTNCDDKVKEDWNEEDEEEEENTESEEEA